MNLADTVEKLRMEYSSVIEYTFDSRARTRKLKCNFCHRSYKYQIILDEHVNVHMNELKILTDEERRLLLRMVFKIKWPKTVAISC